MANEFSHASVGTNITQAEYEALLGHTADAQTTGDTLYFNGTNWVRFAVPSAQVKNSATFAAASGAYTAITFNQEDWDNDTIHDVSTNTDRLTCRTAGEYVVTAYIKWDANASTDRYVQFTVNGTTTVINQSEKGSASVTWETTSVMRVKLAVNDIVRVLVYQTFAANIQTASRFGMVWVGPG